MPAPCGQDFTALFDHLRLGGREQDRMQFARIETGVFQQDQPVFKTGEAAFQCCVGSETGREEKNGFIFGQLRLQRQIVGVDLKAVSRKFGNLNGIGKTFPAGVIRDEVLQRGVVHTHGNDIV